LIPLDASVAAQRQTIVVIVVFGSISSGFPAVAHRNPYVAARDCSRNAMRNRWVEVHVDTISV